MRLNITGKRILSLVLSLVMAFSCFGVAYAADECSHPNLKADGWEVTLDPTCVSEGRKLQYCPDCAKDVVASIPMLDNTKKESHTPGAWVTITPATCEHEGKQVRYCVEGCVKEDGTPWILDERTLPAHNYHRTYYIAPTCMQEGYEVKVCMDCNDIVAADVAIDPDNHNFGEWVVTTEATCSQAGVETRRCINCTENAEQCTVTETREIPADESLHIVEAWTTVTPATCEVPGVKEGVCTVCGNNVTAAIGCHDNAENYKELSKVDATCYKEGVSKRVCDDCGREFEVVLPINPDNHVYSDWRIVKEGDCLPGLREYHCLYHPDEYKVEQSIPANGQHVWGAWIVTEEADCSSEGLKERKCASCGEIEKVAIPITHDYATWETIAVMNCEPGNKVIGVKKAYCNNCNNEKYFNIPAIHNFGPWKITEHANCSTGKVGQRERTCTVCGEKQTEQFTVEHDWSEWSPKEYPVCGEDGKAGVAFRWCNTCNAYETKPIPTTHVYSEWEVETYPTCNTDTNEVIPGKEKSECRYCNEVKYRDLACEHIFSDWKVTVEPVCNPATDGEKERPCIACGYKEIASVAPHSFGRWVIVGDGEAICGDRAKTLKRECKYCGVSEQTTTITAEHPNLVTTVIAPTCASAGYTNDYCPDCDYSATYNAVSPLGHQLAEKWTVRIAPTCSEPGSKYKPCANCAYLEFQVIDRAAHTYYTLEEGVEPTCTETGLTPKTMCLICREEFDHEVIPAKGHVFTQGSEVCAVCNAYFDVSDPDNIVSYNCSCSCHSSNPMTKIIFNIINKFYQLFGINQKCNCHTEEKPCLHYEEVGFIGQLLGRGNEADK